MITEATANDPLASERVLLVADESKHPHLLEHLRRFYPEWSFQKHQSFLSAIDDLGRRQARAVLACVDTQANRLEDAVNGLREAAGDSARLVLCCPPEYEPVARRVANEGGDYILMPFDRSELDNALGVDRHSTTPPRVMPSAPTNDELTSLIEAMAELDGPPTMFLSRVARWIRTAFRAPGCTVVVQGTVASDGASRGTPVLDVPLENESGTMGRLTLPARLDSAYTPGDMERLTLYARLLGRMLEASIKQKRWQELAYTDEASGLPNRRYFIQRLTQILEEAGRERRQVSVLLFDLDDFKTFNDTEGHDVGDRILQAAGELFKKHCRDHDIVTRYGGDEFAVVFWDAEGPRQAGSHHPQCALDILERVSQALRDQPLVELEGENAHRLTISGGLATFPWDGTTPGVLLKKADEALLAAKRAGKNRIFLIGQTDTGETLTSKT